MTKQEIRTEVMSRMNLTSADAEARVDAAIDRHHKRITSLLGMETLRLVSVAVSTGVGNRQVTVPGVEKIDRVFDVTNPTSRHLLAEVSIHNQRAIDGTTGAPQTWAMLSAGAAQVVIILDCLPQVAYSLSIDGWTTRANLLPSDQPLFPASFHDVLTWFVLSEELLRKEKAQLAVAYEQKADALLADLRFHLADTHTRELVQGSHADGRKPGGGGGGGGGAPSGETSFTQTGLITFDRDPDAPFAVTPGSAVVPNLDADKLDGLHASAFPKLSGTPAANQVAVFNGVDVLRGSGALTHDGTTLVAAGGVAGAVVLYVAKTGGVPPTAPTVRATGYSPSYELLDKDGVQNWYFGLNDDDSDALYIGGGYGSGQGVTPHIKIPKGLQTIELPYGRLKFPVGGAVSGEANTLDFYQWGSFTPVFQSTGGQSGQAYQPYSLGNYVRVGRLVTAFGRIGLMALGTFGAGTISIAGLPFHPAIQASATVSFFSNLAIPVASLGGLTGSGDGGTTVIGLYYVAAAGAVSTGGLANTALTASTDMIFTVSYYA